jgi:O-antigen ligase
MLGPIRELVHASIPYLTYGLLWVIVILGAVKRVHWALYMLILLTPLPNVWYQIQDFPLGTHALDLLTMSVVLGIIWNRGGFEAPPRLFLILLITVITYVSLWNSYGRFNLPVPLTLANGDLGDWKNYIEMVLLYVLAYNVARTEKEQQRIMMLIGIVILVSSLRETRNFGAGSSFSYDNRAAGPFWRVGLGANHYAAFLADFGTLLLGLGLVVKEVWQKRTFLAAAASTVYPLFFAYSRGAYMGATAALFVLGLVRVRSLLVVLLALGLTWQAILPTTVVERITMTQTANGQIEESAAERLVMWDHAVTVFHDNPVFGVGFNAFKYTHPPLGLTDTHNYYLKVAVDEGVIGLALTALILVSALWSFWKLYLRARTPFHKGLALGMLGCLTAMMVTNIFGDRWSYYILGSYFWIGWGLVDRGNVLSAQQAVETASAVAADAQEPSEAVTAEAPAARHPGRVMSRLSAEPYWRKRFSRSGARDKRKAQ